MEEFRPIIVDALVSGSINQGLLTTADFSTTDDGAWRLTDEGRRTFLTQYENRRQTELRHPVLNQTMTYQQCFEHQTRLLAQTLQGKRASYPPFLIK
jgi:CRISPR-associated protein Cas1